MMNKMMNKVLAGVVCLLVVAIISTSAIPVGELKEVLDDQVSRQLKDQCAGPKPLMLDETLIRKAFSKFFRVLYDRPVMLNKQLNNYNQFLDDLAQAGNYQVRKEVLHAHSLLVCKSLETLPEATIE